MITYITKDGKIREEFLIAGNTYYLPREYYSFYAAINHDKNVSISASIGLYPTTVFPANPSSRHDIVWTNKWRSTPRDKKLPIKLELCRSSFLKINTLSMGIGVGTQESLYKVLERMGMMEEINTRYDYLKVVTPPGNIAYVGTPAVNPIFKILENSFLTAAAHYYIPKELEVYVLEAIAYSSAKGWGIDFSIVPLSPIKVNKNEIIIYKTGDIKPHPVSITCSGSYFVDVSTRFLANSLCHLYNSEKWKHYITEMGTINEAFYTGRTFDGVKRYYVPFELRMPLPGLWGKPEIYLIENSGFMVVHCPTDPYPELLNSVTIQCIDPTHDCGLGIKHAEKIDNSSQVPDYLEFMPVNNVVSEQDADSRTAGLKIYDKLHVVDIDSISIGGSCRQMAVSDNLYIKQLTNPIGGRDPILMILKPYLTSNGMDMHYFMRDSPEGGGIKHFYIPLDLEDGIMRAYLDGLEDDMYVCMKFKPGDNMIKSIITVYNNGVGQLPNSIERAYYYDYKSRPIQIVERNHLGCISRVSMKYDFVGNILAQHESHKKNINEPEDVLTKHFIYDHRGRLLQDKTILNGGNPAVVSYGYNELGQLIARTYGTGNNAITDSLKYNIQGWLTEQKNQLFDMELKYYDPVKGTKPSYTGNITEWKWEHKGTGDDANTYAFAYDGLSRLTNSQRYEGASTTPLTSFTEQGLSYDRNGNINTLKRYGQSSLDDDFEYTYSGNQLRSLKNAAENDATYTYGYDANGNCTSDGRTGLGFKYNFLNLINQVEKGGGIKARYHWLSDGTKLGVRAYDETGKATNGYEYLGSLVYQYDADGDLRLESAAFGGGRIMASETTLGMDYTPNYFLTDHLGSTRVVVDGSTNQPSQRNDYYAFGMRWDNPLGQTSDNRWLYNGKEDQTGVNVPLTDYGARMYDSRLGRWSSMDPLAEKYYGWSPFNYCVNNPIKFIDPDGRDIWDMDEWGKVKWLEESKKHTMYALGKDGTRTGQSITINDRSIFDGLAATGAESGYEASYAQGNPTELASVFLFGADNSNVEWRFSRYDTGVGDQYAIGTAHNNAKAINPEQMGFARENEIAFIHSHPSISKTGEAERRSMGWRLLTNVEANYHNVPRGSVRLMGDSHNVHHNVIGYPSNANYLTYFPYSGNIYQVRGIQQPAHIRNIKNHNYNGQRLFWGTLNER